MSRKNCATNKQIRNPTGIRIHSNWQTSTSTCSILSLGRNPTRIRIHSNWQTRISTCSILSLGPVHLPRTQSTNNMSHKLNMSHRFNLHSSINIQSCNRSVGKRSGLASDSTCRGSATVKGLDLSQTQLACTNGLYVPTLSNRSGPLAAPA